MTRAQGSPRPFDRSRFASLVEEQLQIVGEDSARDGLAKTPDRVAKAFEELTIGYRQDPRTVVNDALFDVQSDEMVIVCEHHLLPFFGKCHIGYLPQARVIGLSKLRRLVDVFARRLQAQERLTVQIAETVQELTGATGVGVVIEAQHLCMQMRGVEKQSAFALTSSLLGSFRDDPRTRAEFLSLVRSRHSGI